MIRYIRHEWEGELGKRTAKRLLRLKTALKNVPVKSADNLLIGTFNVREFGANKKYGDRTEESILYLAEILDRFDVVAVQEVNNELGDLRRLMRYMDADFDYLLTDITVGAPGNNERLAFLYDKRRVSFGGFAGQVVLPPPRGKNATPDKQLARAPFMVGFKAGWLRFVICTAHIYYGKAIANEPTRVAEIENLAAFLAARAADENAWSQNYVLLGDFNIFKTTDDTYKALENNGFHMPKGIIGQATDLAGNHCYDQIAFMSKLLEGQMKSAKGGALSPIDVCYALEDEAEYAALLGEKYAKLDKKKRSAYYKQWRTFQLSDHRPLWVELEIDWSRGFLANRMNGKPLHVSRADRVS